MYSYGVDSYSIEIKDADNKTYLLCEEVSAEVVTFATYEDADDYNYEFEDTLPDGLTSHVVKTSEYCN
ncbi:hypothetical protein COJ11_32345 [Bacillus cereus]|uniref:hypothetical protein n=1 Tax=Bacillus cereus TaxID=1396 RepID=UPI000BF3C865|nr:hypothetical protein [Bacillus cereus]PFJ84007.1 hypothetical protein COJ11_32345 [Bacillus cereus]PGO63115.1 hypothetical protein CN983_28360 [Bacillus cereus]